MIQVLFSLILVICSVNVSFSFGEFKRRTVQSTSELPDVFTLKDKFGKVDDKELRRRLEEFRNELDYHKALRGYIINYGSKSEIASIEKRIKKHTSRFGKEYVSRIIFVKGGFRKDQTTELHIIPQRAEPPTLTPEKIQTEKNESSANKYE